MGPFEVGDVVVCVDARTPARAGHYGPTQLKNGRIDRVRSAWHDSEFGHCIALEGIEAVTVNGGFLASRFRKIEAPKTEIADRIRACKPVPVTA